MSLNGGRTRKRLDQQIKRGRVPRSGGIPRRPLVSPWWDGVVKALSERPGLRGALVTVDELVALIRGLPGADERRVRNMAVVRRLAPMLELVERGPNGSLSRGARYRVIEPRVAGPGDGNEDWLLAAAERMAGKKG